MKQHSRLLALALASLPLACAGDAPTNPGDGDGGGSPSDPDAAASPGDPDAAPLPPFSFFVTSLDTMREQSGSQDGFGGNLGGLAGADAICQTAAANVGYGHKTWRAFLSVVNGPDGGPVHAIDRIGEGPWYDRNGRLIANDRTGLLQTRPAGDAQTVEDLPDENGQPLSLLGDAHDVLTGSNMQGTLERNDPVSTCYDWTSDVGPGSEDEVRCGHSWPAFSGQHWITAHRLRGCSPGVNLVQNGPGDGDCVGCSGGYGAIYCFALEP
jgi:hypothetical protein